MAAGRPGQLGTQGSENCDSFVNNNIGCPVEFPQADSFGPSFNTNGGGYYAMERTPAFIKVWFWSRNDPAVPAEIKNGGATIAPETWVRI